MLHCNMKISSTLQLGLDDLLGDLQHARRSDQLGRLAVIAYCDVRRWARQAHEWGVAERAVTMFTAEPHASREAFLEQVDRLMFDLEQARARFARPETTALVPSSSIDMSTPARSAMG